MWLVVALLLLLWMHGWINRHVQGLGLLISGSDEVALILYFLLFLPGIVVHEVSHWLAAKLLGVRTGRIAIQPIQKSRGQMRLGSVQVARVDPLRSSLIGLAPLLGGSLLIYLIGELVFGFRNLDRVLTSGDWERFWHNLWGYFHVPDFWLWLYLIFVIANAMLPSETDRQPWRSVLIFLGLVAVLFYLFGWVPQVPAEWTEAFLTFISYLAHAFGLTVVVDLVFIVVIFLSESLLSALKRTRVEY